MVFKFEPVDSVDAVPAEFRAVYSTTANAQGKFEVAEPHKAFVSAYLGNVTALEQERGKVRNLNTENAQRRQALQPYQDLVTELGITPEGDDIVGAIRTHVTGLQDKVKGGEQFRGNLAKIREETEKRIAQITGEKDKEIAAMRRTLESYLIDKEALGALSTAKAKGGGAVLLPTIKGRVKVIKNDAGGYDVRAVNSDGTVQYNNAAQPKSINDIVAELKSDPATAFAFESESNGGTGSPPGGSARPAQGAQPKPGEKTSTQKISAGLDALGKK